MIEGTDIKNLENIGSIINSDVAIQIKNSENFSKQEQDLEEELMKYPDEILAENIRRLKNENAEQELNIQLKKDYSGNIFRFMCLWTLLVFIIIFLDSLTYTPIETIITKKDLSFDVSDSVMMTLIGGTTVSVIGLVGFVVKGLFPSVKSNKEKKKK